MQGCVGTSVQEQFECPRAAPGSARSVFLPGLGWWPEQARSRCDGQHLPSLAPKATGVTRPLPEEAGHARRRLIPSGKFKPRFSVTTAICHWTRM